MPWVFVFVLALLGGAVLVTRSVAPRVRQLPARVSEPVAAPNARALIGQKLFFDVSLSEPPGTSCAACHDPEHGYAGVNGSERGVARGSRPGHFARRRAPSTMYLRFVPRFHIEWDDEADLPEARGGFFWDGRASSLAELVRQPLLNPDEMANPSLDAIAKKLAGAPLGSCRATARRRAPLEFQL